MIVIAPNIVVSAGEESYPDSTPWIGWHTLADSSTVSSLTAATGYPVTNLGNPLTQLKWKGNTAIADEVVTVNTSSYLGDIDYLAIAKHNLGTNQIPVLVEVSPASDPTNKVKMLFDGADGSTTFTDTNTGGSSHTWTGVGTAQLDTAIVKYGTAALLLNGAGDIITTPDHADFNLAGLDFRIEGYARTASVGIQRFIMGQADSTPTAAASSFRIGLTAAAKLQAQVYVGSSTISLTGTTTVSAGVFFHFALVRNGTTLYLFLNGALEATASIGTGVVNNSSQSLAIGLYGAAGGGVWHGSIDQVRMFVGTNAGKWTSSFDVPNEDPWDIAIPTQVLPDDSPVIFKFSAGPRNAVRFRMKPGLAVPEIAVLYVGKLLVMERSIKIDVDHVPMKYGRRAKVVTNFSETGNYLGRIVTQHTRESRAEFAHITPNWYRSSLDPFIAVSKTTPFFFAWNPEEYPLESGFAWMINEPVPATNPVTRRVAITFDMRGIP